jgi:Asp-tRNA(Asn)/Glu-tRNA(Gln) amidotransferase A subunit family amidase
MSLWRPWSLRQLVADLNAGRTTPEAALVRSDERISETEGEIHAWVTRGPEPALPAGGPLGGVPLGVKDIIDVAGYPTRCGSELRAGGPPAERDAAIVTAWREAGAVPVGKTVTTEFAYFAPGPTTNPAASEHTPGGSSSGSAAAVASGQVPLALGSQTAGSVIRPASYCGIASMVMARRRFPTDGVVGLSPSLDSHGMFAASVSDLALAWAAFSGAEDVAAGPGSPPRLLLWSAAPIGVVTPAMQAAVAASAERLRSMGATVDVFPLEQLIAELAEAHCVIMAYEASRERADELAMDDRISQPLADLLRAGASISHPEFQTARGVVADANERIVRTFATYDAILGPGAPGAAPKGLDATGNPVLSRAWQSLGLPAVGVPGLQDGAGLPLGLQVIGHPDDELGTLRAAAWVEQNLPI